MFNKTSGAADKEDINRVEKEVMHIKASIDTTKEEMAATKEEMAATKEELMVALKANSEATMLAFNQLADKLAKTE